MLREMKKHACAALLQALYFVHFSMHHIATFLIDFIYTILLICYNILFAIIMQIHNLNIITIVTEIVIV